MNVKKYDVIVIGTGPGGEGAAMQAVKKGKSVAVVEKNRRVGGGCTHKGTIPSKTLRHVIQRNREFINNPLWQSSTDHQLTYPQMIKAAASVIARQVSMREGFYVRNNVPVFYGEAVFQDPHTVGVHEEHGAVQTLQADYIVIATGSRPWRPANVDFNHPNIFDADTILNMNRTPKSITIYGAGVIGCEYASMFRGMGIKLNLVNNRDRLLDYLDDEISDALAYHLREQGALIRHNEDFESVEGLDDGVLLNLKSGKRLKTDVLLWAAGRTGNSDKLGLEKIGLEADSRGQLSVNENLQTALPHIYAVGDITGPPALASAAYAEGRFAAVHIVEGKADKLILDDIPSGIYTSPEISSLGKTEQQLTEERISYEVGHAAFKSLARAQITGETVGMLKILFHTDTLELLGIHCFGHQAAEIIHIGQAIMAQKGEANSLMYFINATFNYPTMAEAYRVAALNGLNRLH
jgi:NAD(P) transhydrogenase